MDKTLEQVKAEYVLSQEEHNEISKKIKTIMFFGKSPSSKPKAIINIVVASYWQLEINKLNTIIIPKMKTLINKVRFIHLVTRNDNINDNA